MIDLNSNIKIKNGFEEWVLNQIPIPEFMKLGPLVMEGKISRTGLEPRELAILERQLLDKSELLIDVMDNLQGIDEDDDEGIDISTFTGMGVIEKKELLDLSYQGKLGKSTVVDNWRDSVDLGASHSQDWDKIVEVTKGALRLLMKIFMGAKNKSKEHWEEYVNNLVILSTVITVLALLMWAFGGDWVNKIPSLTIAAAGLTTFIIGVIVRSNVYQGEEVVIVDEPVIEEPEEEEEYEDDDDDNEYEEVNDWEVDNRKRIEAINDEVRDYLNNFYIKMNKTDVSSDDAFGRRVKRAFKESDKYRNMGVIRDRIEVLESMQEYIFCNNPKFAEMRIVSEKEQVYKNICFLIYRGLCKIKKELKYDGEHTMIVMDMVETPVMYKVSMKLPTFINKNEVNSKIKEIEDQFRAHDKDKEVSIRVSGSGQVMNFKIAKFGTPIITFGDAIRYIDPINNYNTFEEFSSPRKEVPIIIGLQEGETPVIVDLKDINHAAIVGVSGSGKSWALFNIVFSTLIQSRPCDVSYILMDYKGETIYSQLARAPHVFTKIGVETEQWIDMIEELEKVMTERQKMLDHFRMGKWEELRINMKNKNEDPLPYIVVVLEEIASFLASLKALDKKRFDVVKQRIGNITRKGRSVGIKLIFLAQRGTDANIPRDFMNNCNFKMGFRLVGTDSDFENMGMDVRGVTIPDSVGAAIVSYPGSGGKDEIVALTTIGIGGNKDDHVINLLRMLTLEWQIRMSDKEVYRGIGINPKFDQRRKNRVDVLNEYKRHEFLSDEVQVQGSIQEYMARISGEAPEEIVLVKKEEITEIEEEEPEIDFADNMFDILQKETVDVVIESTDVKKSVMQVNREIMTFVEKHGNKKTRMIKKELLEKEFTREEINIGISDSTIVRDLDGNFIF